LYRRIPLEFYAFVAVTTKCGRNQEYSKLFYEI
jgi:hypothetical protein